MKAYKELKKDLFSFKSEKLTKFSILLIILLDLFLFGLVLEGIDKEQEKNIRTSEVFPYPCMSKFKSESGFSYSQLDSYRYKHISSDFTGNTDQRCQTLEDKFNAFKNDSEIKENKKLYTQLNKKLSKVKRELKRLKARYDTELLEVIAKQKEDTKDFQDKYQSLIAEEQMLNSRLKQIKRVTSYQVYQNYLDYKHQHRQQVKEDRDSYQKWYKFKQYLYTLKFVLPLFLIVLFFYFRNKTKQLRGEDFNNISLIISSHLLIILAIPLFIGFLDIIYSVIPKMFFANIIAFFVAIKAEFLGFYGIMLLAVLFVFALIYALQKYEKKKHKRFAVIYKSINKSVCYNCKNKVDYSKDKYCGVCAEQILEKCEHCNELKIKKAPHCRNCGK